ncbi:hypothetical protein [Micromonospora sp. RTGN7]|uniref:hypothetical protein n=1 Tax=Micromonospora sp. RTGN7 TaxID=3016526 RepID=UPI0029FF28B6|nr:hypothetical protein [Micromonospora sp. RTGN7]
MTHEDEDIRFLLTEAVPPLAPPPDRVGAVARRVRRRRRRLSAGTALAVALTVGVGVGGVQILAGGDHPPAPRAATQATIREARCPVDLREFPNLESARYGDSEPLVPGGALEITACEVPNPAGRQDHGRTAPRVLTTGVGDIVRALNSLPPHQTMGGAGSPAAVERSLRCTAVAYDRELAYVLRYHDRQPVTVYTSANCRVAVSGAQGRGLDPALFATFLDRYRAQIVAQTPPATIPTPACASRIPTSRLRLTPGRSGLDDQVSANNPSKDPQLPSKLVAVVACRYEVGEASARLIGQDSDRDDADALRPFLNTAFDQGKVTSCGSYPGYPPPAVLDSLIVADATGATAEFWLRRTPCQALVGGRSSGVTPTDALVAALDRRLGPPPTR